MLYAHQKEAVKLLIDNPRFALYHEQGLGKTITSIIAADYSIRFENIEKVTVICPAFLQKNWFDEIKKWSKTPEKYRIFSYEKFKNLDSRNKFCDFLIVDEAHYIKNRKALRTQCIVNIAHTSKRVILLTGTPVGNNSILDLYTHLVVLNPDNIYAKYSCFYASFCEKGHKFDKIKTKNESTFMKQLESFTQRKTKNECLDLPPKLYKTISCKGTRSPKNLHVSHKMQLQEGYRVDVVLKDGETILGTTSHDSTSEKLNTLTEIIDCIDDKAQIVIYVAFVKSLKYISQKLDCEKISHKLFLGDLSEKEKNKVLSEFKEKKFRVLIATMQSLNVGVTLTNCSNVIYFSRTFSRTEREQSEDRFHRIGQHNVVEYVDIVADGVDKKAFDMIKANKSIDEIRKEIEQL